MKTILGLLLLALSSLVIAEDKKLTRDQMVHRDKAQLQDNDHWIYNNLQRGIDLAKSTKKPLFVVFRCIP